MFPYNALFGLTVALTLALPLAAESATVNVDLKGVSNYQEQGLPPGPDPLNPTYVGQGPAGGGTVFNGVLVDSRVYDGSGDYTHGDFFLTVTAPDLLDSDGNATSISFTTSQVGGDGGAVAVEATDPAALLADYLFVGYPPQPETATAGFMIGGLAGFPVVDLYFYGGNATAVTIPGAAPAPFTASGIFTSTSLIYFKNVPVIDGQLSGTFGSASIIAGLTIVTPEPGPFVVSASPSGNAVQLDPIIELQLQDYITEVDPFSIQLFFNGQAVAPVITEPSGTTTLVTYVPGTLLPNSRNTFSIIFSDTSAVPVTRTNDFAFRVGPATTIAINFRADAPDQTLAPTDTAGVLGTANWNNVPVATTSVSGLVDSTGAATAVNLLISGSPLGYQVGNTAPAGGDKKMMTGHIYVGPSSGTIDVGITGLDSTYTDDLGYDLYVYYRSGGDFPHTYAVLDGSLTTVAGPVTVGDSTDVLGFNGTYVASDGAGSAGHYYKFGGLHLTDFTLRTQPLPGTFAYISGLQIVKVLPLGPPEVQSVAPGPIVTSNAPVVIAIQDFGTQLTPSTVQLFFNDVEVSPVLDKPAGATVTTITYQPPETLPRLSTNAVTLIFGDNSLPTFYQTNEFSYVYLSYAPAPLGTIGINFRADDPAETLAPTDTAGVLASANWNNVPAATTSVSGLMNSAGAATAVNLLLSGLPAGYLAFQAGNSAPLGGDKKMMTGHIYVGGGGEIDVALSGLDESYTGNGYDVYVYYRSGSDLFKPGFSVLDGTGATIAGPVTVMDSAAIGFNGFYVASDGAGSAGHYYRFANLHAPEFTLKAVPVDRYAFVSGLQIVPALNLKIVRGPEGSLIVSWVGEGTLQWADDITGPWVDMTGQNSPYTFTPSGPGKFYRVKQ